MEKSSLLGQQTSETNAALQELLRRPALDGSTPPNCDWEGKLLKKSRTNHWATYYFLFVPEDMELRYYKNKEKTRGVIPLSWITPRQVKVEDRLVHNQLKQKGKVILLTQRRGGTICKYRVRVLSPKRVYTISAETDEDMEAWISVLTKALHSHMTPEEIAAKKTAAQEMEPIFQLQVKQQMEQYVMVVRVLQQAGIFATKISGKKKEGYLHLLKTNNRWKKYYFVLLKHSLVYFDLTDKV